ncbi:hypothetical protein YC2023_063810 [Brassica napus]
MSGDTLQNISISTTGIPIRIIGGSGGRTAGTTAKSTIITTPVINIPMILTITFIKTLQHTGEAHAPSSNIRQFMTETVRMVGEFREESVLDTLNLNHVVLREGMSDCVRGRIFN